MRLIDADNIRLASVEKYIQINSNFDAYIFLEDLPKILDVQPTVNTTIKKHECKDCAGCTQWRCDTANVIQEYKENLIEKLKDKIEYDERIERRKGANYYDETERIKQFDERARGVEIAIEIIKDNEYTEKRKEQK